MYTLSGVFRVGVESRDAMQVAAARQAPDRMVPH